MSCFRSKLDAIVIGNGVLRLNNLFEFPFLRFDDVILYYNDDSHPIANKCEIFASQLQKLPRLNESNSISVWATVNQKRRDHFIDHTQLLEHLRNLLLPIFRNCRRYEFRISLGSDKDTVANIVTSILEVQQVNECSNVGIHLGEVRPFRYDYRLPVETISNWLHRSRNADNGENEFSNQKQRERVLEIEAVYISNVLEMLNHLKEVLFNCL